MVIQPIKYQKNQSPLFALGCMSFGSPVWRKWVLDSDQSQPLLKVALDNNITFFDTANVYSEGLSEQILGSFLKKNADREDIVLATKMFYPSPETPEQIGLTKKNIISSLEGSLKRLNTDYIDIYQTHRWDEFTPIEETMEAFHSVIKSGKVRYIGASNMRCWQLAKAQLVAKDQGWEGFATMQNHYNLLYREDERDLIPFCQDQGIHLMPWSPLARGRIARADASKSTTRSDDDAGIQNTLYGSHDDSVLHDIAQIASEHNASPSEIGISWLLHKNIQPIIGATKKKHILDAVNAQKIKLTENDIKRLEKNYTPRRQSELPWSPTQKERPK